MYVCMSIYICLYVYEYEYVYVYTYVYGSTPSKGQVLLHHPPAAFEATLLKSPGILGERSWISFSYYYPKPLDPKSPKRPNLP